MSQVTKSNRGYWIPKPAPGNYTVISTTPTNAATNVPVNQVIKIEFSTPMLGTTVNNTNITMSPSPSRTTALFRDDCTAIITPGSNLSNNTTYTVTATTNLKSLFGWQPLSAQYQFSFTTVP
jgi:hypothetical protein